MQNGLEFSPVSNVGGCGCVMENYVTCALSIWNVAVLLQVRVQVELCTHSLRPYITMTSCQTWTTSSHIRHPWFDASIMKRKHRETVSPDDDLGGVIGPVSAASAAKPPPPKRRRCSNLEQGFAHLTLGSTPVVAAGGSGKTFVSPPPMYSTMREMPMASVDADMPLASTSTSTYPTDRLPYTIEEPPAPEVKMKVSSWYEPEPDRASYFFLLSLLVSSSLNIL